MSMTAFKLVGLLFMVLWQFQANASIDYNANCRSAYAHALQFRFQEMEAELQKESLSNPDNMVITSIEAFSYFLKYSISEDPLAIEKFKKSYTQAVDLLEDEIDKNPYNKYLLADLYLQSAFVNVLETNYITAIYYFKKVNSLAHENQSEFPNFEPNNKTLGILNIVIGSVPKSYNWALTLLGLEGDVKQGYSQLESFFKLTQKKAKYEYLFTESLILYSFTESTFDKTKSKLNPLQQLYTNAEILSKYASNQLFIFAKVSFHQHRKENEEALKALELVQPEFVTNPNKLYYLDHMYGESLLYKQSPASSFYFNRYIEQYPGKRYIPSAHQKMGWAALLQGKKEVYWQQMKAIVADQGDYFDSDKQAIKEAENKKIPNVTLLKSRLLFDGGYYQEAELLLRNGFLAGKYITDREKLEYTYRLARIFDETANFALAEVYYKSTIEKGRNFPYYFAANSALNLAMNYESLGKIAEAKTMFQLCLELEFDEYENSITQKAKAGLNRLK